MKIAIATLLLFGGTALLADTSPTPGADDARLQTLIDRPGESARLVAFPDGSLTLIMRRGDQVTRVSLSDNSAFRVAITGNNDSINITPLRTGATASMEVETRSGNHHFTLETGQGLAAAYVVRLVPAPRPSPDLHQPQAKLDLSSMRGRYSMKGDRGLRPRRIADDGAKTYIDWSSEQPLPAVLGVGAGGEEVVPGYMRNGLFTIDRVYSELVFRIDRRAATAVRQSRARK